VPPPSLNRSYVSVWVDGNAVLVGGEKSLRSLDRGATWQEVSLSSDAALAFWGTGSGDLWAVGGEYWGNPTFFGTVFHSADGGVTWSKQVGTYLPGDPMLPPSVSGLNPASCDRVKTGQSSDAETWLSIASVI
jgi:hypothetical protein